MLPHCVEALEDPVKGPARPADAVGVIDKRTERVYLETEHHRIMGDLTLARDGYRSRVSDFLNATEREFLTLTDATVELVGNEGKGTVHPVVSVSRRHIVLAIPQNAESAAAA